MFSFFKRLSSKNFIGVDVGTFSIKLVEIQKTGKLRKLENYGEVSSAAFHKKPFRSTYKNSLLFSSENIAQAVRMIIDEAGIKTKQAVFSIPDFSTFFTSFDLPPMSEEELGEAVKYEARQHIPLPLSEVVLDWQIIKSKPLGDKKTSFKILLVAVPNEVVKQYQDIARMAHLELVALEAEVFSLVRSLFNNKTEKTVAIVDIGAKTTTCTIVDEGIIKVSHSFDMSGNDFTATLAKELAIDFTEAEKIKSYCGRQEEIHTENNEEIRKILCPCFDVIAKEVKEILDSFSLQEKKPIEKVILAGGAISFPGIQDRFKEALKIPEIEGANPFLNLDYPPILKETLLKMGSRFAIAVGAALRGLQR